jgi:hypothetical protein
MISEQAEMSERGIYDRTKVVFQYFNLPSDAGPPPAGSAFENDFITRA